MGRFGGKILDRALSFSAKGAAAETRKGKNYRHGNSKFKNPDKFLPAGADEAFNI
jgi:hypothetical protein